MTEGAGDCKKAWDIINTVLGRHKNCKLSDKFIHSNNEIDEPDIIAQHFNSYFVNVGKSLADNMSEPVNTFDSYLTNQQELTFSMPPVTSEEIINTVSQLRDSSPGYDGIPMKLLRVLMPSLCPVILYLCNMSFSTGIFPKHLKIAKVLPLYKSGDGKLFKNHRPISVLPVISKILEKIMYNRLSEFCKSNNIISDAQYGFRRGKSTETALTTFSNDVLAAFDNRLFTISVFLDLAKAFDTVNHSILLEKLKHYGIRNNTYTWFESYLQDRKQYVEYRQSKSSELTLSIGVPQGSILGPLLFNLYVNDFVNSNALFKTILFADDTTLYASHNNLNTLVQSVNNELYNVYCWMNANKLTLNIDKTKYIIHHRKKSVPPHIDSIKIGNSVIMEEQNVKFLGVVVDRHLTWQSHIQNLTDKMNKQCGILYLTRSCFPTEVLKQLYYSLVYPYLSYCHTIWATAGITITERVKLALKRTVRTITFKRKYDHTNDLFKSLRLLKWEDINIYCTAIYVYKSINNDNYTEIFNFRSNERYSLRNTRDLEIPALTSNQSQKSIKYHGVKVWNALPQYVRDKSSPSGFKISLKSYLLSKY